MSVSGNMIENEAAVRHDSTPLVSIALCTYNSSKFIAAQIESLLAQTYPHSEIVVVDDCSTDDTVSVLERYARRHSRFRIVVNERNLGFAKNFEKSLLLCSGAYIAPCDHDDIWLPEKISVLAAAIGTQSLVYCDSALVNEEGMALGYCMSDVVSMLSTDDPAAFVFGNCVSGHAMLFRRELLQSALPVPPDFFYDWWLAAVAAAAGGIVFVDKALVQFRQHGGNVTDRRLGEMLVEAGLASKPEKPSSTRSRGEKLRHLQETGRRLRALARLPGRHQSFVARLSRLWSARETQWLSPTLACLMYRERRRLFAVTKWPERKQIRYCRRLFWGLRAKRMTSR